MTLPILSTSEIILRHLEAVNASPAIIRYILGLDDLPIIEPLITCWDLAQIKEWLVTLLTPSTPDQYNTQECETRRLIDDNMRELLNRDPERFIDFICNFEGQDLLGKLNRALCDLDILDRLADDHSPDLAAAITYFEKQGALK